jgi:glycosyltransferase involved in cell wall biosynthesis
VATYYRGDFYRSLLAQENVEHHFLGGRGKLWWTLNVRRFLGVHGQDVVLAYLPGPSAYAELAGLPRRSWGLVVSERSAGVRSRVKAKLHTLTDYLVVNSHAARIAIGKEHPQLQPKLATIYNAVDLEPCDPTTRVHTERREVWLVVAARLDRNKNAQGLLLAVHAARAAEPSLRLRVDWYGNQVAEPEVHRQTSERIASLGLHEVFHLLPPTDNIHRVMSNADAVVLPSFHEGLPNSVCEGMALGKPVLISAVCDAGYLVQDGINGLLFDPYSYDSIAEAISRFARLTHEERTAMGNASRSKAEVLFNVNTIVEHYLRVLEAAAARKAIKVENWPEEVPETALPSLSGHDGGESIRG